MRAMMICLRLLLRSRLPNSRLSLVARLSACGLPSFVSCLFCLRCKPFVAKLSMQLDSVLTFCVPCCVRLGALRSRKAAFFVSNENDKMISLLL